MIQKNIPNLLSISRIFLSIIFSILLYNITLENSIYLIILFTLIGITDILDGYLARKKNNTTELGAKIDIIADMTYVTFSFIVLYLCNIIPLWFIIFLIIKFSEFVITSYAVKKYYKNPKHAFLFDKLGKNMAIITMFLPGIIVLMFLLSINTQFLNILLYILLTIGSISFIQRIYKCYKIIKNP